ncbi:restriction endonuclease [Pseudonocardia xinjiangensis]|uniref:Restriction endonuclease n=1 Tax=Pseudonocardia xinjiangensis TaxID=75289 RepID=A0ABX1RBF3_9PSEU|nr:restriction endonuclease [Pseudonocardia xinjiangensis]NMH77229.1 restriction endonuclease [Pseudonocardia xinjiangensis]
MLSRSALRGYVLEELLAKLLQRSGYSLLVREEQDPIALSPAANGLRVRGRGSEHQVDVLGELDWPIPFSLPVRLFVEAKYRGSAVGLADVRNALGVINDVNEHYSAAAASNALPRPFRRYHYRYALFSASGFTADAQQFAYAQQISLVELDGPAFRWLLDAASRAADELLELALSAGLDSFPVNQMREAFRRALGTWTVTGDGNDSAEDGGVEDDFGVARSRAERAAGGVGATSSLPAAELAAIAAQLVELDGALYFGFTAAPFLLVVQPDDPESFDRLGRADGDAEPARLAFAGPRGGSGEWVLVADDGSVLRFGLAPLYEQFVLGAAPSDLRRDGRRSGASRSVTVLGETSDVTLRFVPVAEVGAGDGSLDDDRTSLLRAMRADPALEYRGDRDRVVSAIDRWSWAAAARLVYTLRAEGRPQAEVIIAAARNGGFLDRATVYRIAEFSPQRTLRGFTRPAKRITAILHSEGVVAADVAPPLVALYDHGVLATRFQVPPEFVEILPSIFD